MGDRLESLVEVELRAVERFCVGILMPVADHAIINRGKAKHRMGGSPSTLHGVDVVARGPVAYLALDTVLLPKGGIELPGLRVGGGGVTSEANGALSRLHVHTGDLRDLKRLREAQRRVSLRVVGELPQAKLIAALYPSVTWNAGADAHVEGGSRPLRRPPEERESQANRYGYNEYKQKIPGHGLSLFLLGLLYCEELIGFYISQNLHLPAGPTDFDFGGFGLLSEAEVNPQVARGKIR